MIERSSDPGWSDGLDAGQHCLIIASKLRTHHSRHCGRERRDARCATARAKARTEASSPSADQIPSCG